MQKNEWLPFCSRGGYSSTLHDSGQTSIPNPEHNIPSKALSQFFRQLPGFVPIRLNSILTVPGNGIRGNDGTIKAQCGKRFAERRATK